MKHLYTLLFLAICSVTVIGQEDFNLDLIAEVPVGEGGSDIWGYVDANGIEYAIMGSSTRISVYSLEDPSNPILRTEVLGSNSLWRDIKTYNDHIYFTTDTGSDGLGIIDMSEAPETITSLYWTPELTIAGFTDQLRTCHNLYIDEGGYCYLAGCNVPDQFNTNGTIILDLNQDPKEPVVISDITGAYAHDVVVRNDTLFSSDIFNGEFSVYDVTDKANPVFLASRQTSSTFTHNAWFSDDGNFLFTTDELENSYVDAYDISDLDNIFETDRFRPLETEGNGVIPHNTHYMDGYLITSWYTDGVVITDVSDPFNMVKVGAYDTFQGEENIQGRWFQGVWGVYPWLPSGLLLASDINRGLLVFDPTYQRASLLTGTVTDIETELSISGADVRVVDRDFNLDSTDPNGQYTGGDILEGEITLEFSHPLYATEMLTANVVNGETTIVDAQLTPITELITGRVVDVDGAPINNATTLLVNAEQMTTVFTNADGFWQAQVLDLPTTIYGGAWGFRNSFTTIQSNTETDILVTLQDGFYDDYFLDLGWESINQAQSGAWVRDVPIGTDFQGQISNPGGDIAGDLGGRAYITGNAGGGAGNDDVDGGTVILRSPSMDLTEMINPELTFAYWFFNAGGQGAAPDDTLTVIAYNATETVTVFSASESTSQWTPVEGIILSELFEDVSDIRVDFITSDINPNGHLVEAGVDIFEIKGEFVSSIFDFTDEAVNQLDIYPNPTSGLATIDFSDYADANTVTIQTIDGRIIYRESISNKTSITISTAAWQSGLYMVKSEQENGEILYGKLSVE